ncbi:MAG: signal peptide peptidase SppA [bacterium]|nr:signal peptide peptidase SppA [bacterium]
MTDPAKKSHDIQQKAIPARCPVKGAPDDSTDAVAAIGTAAPGFLRKLATGAALLACMSLPACFNDVYVSLSPVLPGQGGGDLEEVQLDPPVSADSGSCLYSPSASGEKILLIPIDGVIGEGGFLAGGFTNPAYIKEILDRAENDPEIKAVILRINSPGGTVSASDLIYRLISDYTRENNVPVYAHIADIGASGGYYVAMAAKEVNMRPMGIVGSIGVIIRGFGVAGLMDKLGIEYRSIASGEMKDSLSPFKEMTEKEKAYFMRQIDRSYDNFLDIILKSRSEKLSKQSLQPLADGRVFDAETALKNNLVDSTVYLDEYLEKLAQENGWREPRVVAYLPEGSAGANPNLYSIGGAAPLSPTQKLMLLAQLSGHRLFYLWEAGI